MKHKKNCVVRFRLGEILKEKEMTQTAASAATGLSRQALIKLVNAPKAVQMETLGKICSGLDVAPTELFEVTEE